MASRFREPVSGFTHLAGAVLAAIGLIGLIAGTAHDPERQIPAVVYGISLVLVFCASSALHLTRGSDRTILWLQRIDHASIYLLIAGTYTPFCVLLLSGMSRWVMLIFIWAIAAVGVIYKLLFLKKDGLLSTVAYVAMGWVGIILIPTVGSLLPAAAIALVLGGGVIYTIGAVIFALGRPNLHRYFTFHDLWHLFVLGGSALHFIAVAHYAV